MHNLILVAGKSTRYLYFLKVCLPFYLCLFLLQDYGLKTHFLVPKVVTGHPILVVRKSEKIQVDSLDSTTVTLN